MMYPLVHYEDDSFQCLRTDEERASARRWRYFLEETIGLYNADITHVCVPDCFEPLHTHADTNGEGKSLRYIHAIDVRHRIYGCPRSGRIHQCPLEKHLRVEHCKIVCASTTDSVHCRYSGLEVYSSPPKYNPYTDNHFTFNEPLKTSYRVEESMRRATAIYEQRPAKEADAKDKLHGRFDRHTMKTTTRALRGLALRTSAPGVLPSPSPTSTKRSRIEFDDASDNEHERERERKCSTPPPSLSLPSSLSSSSVSGSEHANTYSPRSATTARTIALVDTYEILVETYGRIKRVVTEILFDPLVQEDFTLYGPTPHTIPTALGDATKEHEIRRLFYLNRFALLFAILLEEQNRANATAAAPPALTAPTEAVYRSRGALRRNKKTNNKMRLDPKKTTLALMYMLSNGLYVMDKNVLTDDQFLREAMPLEIDLCWYGIESGYRRAYLKLASLPSKDRVKYTYDRPLAQYIQKLFNRLSGSTYLFSRILNGDLG